ncbi:MAG: DUF3987 domain-containing protein, partial [Deltaproteobacteria bacterium]|nr:DUF3987 domain-containing protein [Deltaproteobacteria bacterium]
TSHRVSIYISAVQFYSSRISVTFVFTNHNESSVLYGRRISIHIMAQPEVAYKFISDDLLKNVGLHSRCLIAYPQSTIGTRSYKSQDLFTDDAYKTYKKKIETILRAKLPLKNGALNELEPRILHPNDRARLIWIDFHDDVEAELREGGKFADVRGIAAKAPEHVLRLAGVITLIDDLDARFISEEQVFYGIDLVEYYLDEALRLADIGMIDPDLALAEKLYEWSKGRRLIPLADIYQSGPRPIRDKTTALRIAEKLEEHGLWERIDDGSNNQGNRKSNKWRVVE